MQNILHIFAVRAVPLRKKRRSTLADIIAAARFIRIFFRRETIVKLKIIWYY